jgi:FMN phosphatase YigB (HAD superfamily)
LIEAIFFDYDGVLTLDKTGTLTTCRYLSRRTGIPYESFRQSFELHAEDLRIGKLTRLQVWPAVCAALGRELSRTLLIEAYQSTPTNEPMFALARRLKAHHTVGIITDNTKDRFDCLKVHQRLPDLFSPIILSAEVGSTKGAPAIFQRALAAAKVRPERAIFLDNSKANVVVAQTLGMKGIHFDDERNDVDALARILVAEFGVSLNHLPGEPA